MGRRLGLIVPSSNTVMEVDFYRRLPPQLTLHTARMHLKETTVAGESAMLDVYLPQAVTDLATVHPEVVVFGCTSAGALRGTDYDARLCREIAERTGAEVVSVIAAVKEALRAAGAVKVGVVTPYIAALNDRIQSSLEHDGFEVVSITGMGITTNFAIATVEPAAIADFALAGLCGQRIDAAFISCTNFRGLEASDLVTRRLKIPVVTSNGAALAAALAVAREDDGGGLA